jgi:elongation factor 1-gamma
MQAAQVNQWIEFSVNEIDLPGSVWVFPILGYIPNNALATQRAKGDIRKVLEILNNHLADKTYLVGERISLADIVAATSLHRLYERVLDPQFRKAFVNTNRWFTTIVNQPEYLHVAGNIVLCTKMEAAPKGDVAEGESKPAEKQPKKEQKEQQKEQKPKKEEPPKEEKKPQPKKKKEEEDDGDDGHEDEEPKGKNPLDFLPASKMVLDDWKRKYSNEDTKTVANPWFWENYDKEGYCLYFADYKYNNEIDKKFKAANLASGWLQRLDKLRKYGFGCIIIFGTDEELEICSCWLFRGTEIPQEMKECDDYEHYTWTKVDVNDPNQREIVSDYWAWEGKFGGKNKPIVEGKAFK